MWRGAGCYLPSKRSGLRVGGLRYATRTRAIRTNAKNGASKVALTPTQFYLFSHVAASLAGRVHRAVPYRALECRGGGSTLAAWEPNIQAPRPATVMKT